MDVKELIQQAKELFNATIISTQSTVTPTQLRILSVPADIPMELVLLTDGQRIFGTRYLHYVASHKRSIPCLKSIGRELDCPACHYLSVMSKQRPEILQTLGRSSPRYLFTALIRQQSDTPKEWERGILEVNKTFVSTLLSYESMKMSEQIFNHIWLYMRKRDGAKTTLILTPRIPQEYVETPSDLVFPDYPIFIAHLTKDASYIINQLAGYGFNDVYEICGKTPF